MSREDRTKLLEAYKDDAKLFIYIFDLMTGLRIGELCALTHADVDLKNNLIHVTKSLNRVTMYADDGTKSSQIVISNPKTKKGIREIPIPTNLIAPIKEHVLREKKKHFKLGIKFEPSNFFFTSNTCTAIRGDHLNDYWKRKQAELNFEFVVVFHGLRHTFCTLLAEKGVPLKTAAVLMGHEKIETTAQIYTHVDKQSQVEAIDLLSEIISF
nr:site-specific integrase [Fusibacter ferrireducens]